MKTKTKTATKLKVCTKTVAESFAGFSDRNLRKVTITLLKMLCKRAEDKDCDTTSPKQAELLYEVICAVNPRIVHASVVFEPKKRCGKNRVRKAA